jgi:hypothetical protein
MNNIFVNNDPLLQQNEYAGRLEQLRQMQAELEQAKRQQVHGAPAATPIWDEISRQMEELTEAEESAIRQDREFIQSEQHIMAIVNQEYMRAMRPIVEGTKEGREALESHLALLKVIRKRAKQESARSLDEWKEYTEKYSHMTFKKYKEMKGGGK